MPSSGSWPGRRRRPGLRASSEISKPTHSRRPEAEDMTENTAPPPQVWPTLRARDARALIKFLVNAFGFEETAVYGERDHVHYAELTWPLGGGIMLGSAREPSDKDPWPLQPGTFGAYVVTDDSDALCERARK